MLSRAFRRAFDFLTSDLWRIRSDRLRPSRSFLLKHTRIIVLACRGFYHDKCGLRASALTFYTLLALVPVVALAFAIAKGFGFQAVLKEQLFTRLSRYPEVAEKISDFAERLLESAKGGIIAGIGVVVLLWAIIRVLSHIENAFNHIWGVKKGRNWGRRIADYFSLLLVCPILVVFASSATVFIRTQIQNIVSRFSGVGELNVVGLLAIKALPLLVVWITFAFIYLFMPNTRVKLWSGLLAGIVAGTIYQMVQWLYIALQVGVTKYSAVYGSFAALPLFLIWLQLSWLIVLFGAEVSFAHQNVPFYELEPDCLRVSRWFKKLLSLRLVHLLVKNFGEASRPPTAGEISHRLRAPIRLVNDVLFELVEAGVVSETATERLTEPRYQPGRETDKLTVKYVLDALDRRGVDNIPLEQSPAVERIKASLADFDAALEASPANVLLKNI